MFELGKSVKALENRPVLLPGLDFYFQAYAELSHDRPVGFGVGSIPWSSIINWCKLHEIHDINEIDACIKHIRALEKADHEISESKKAK